MSLLRLALALFLVSSSLYAKPSLRASVKELNSSLEQDWNGFDMDFYQEELREFQIEVNRLPTEQKLDKKKLLLKSLSYLPHSDYQKDMMESIAVLDPKSVTFARVERLLREHSPEDDEENRDVQSSLVAGISLVIMGL